MTDVPNSIQVDDLISRHDAERVAEAGKIGRLNGSAAHINSAGVGAAQVEAWPQPLGAGAYYGITGEIVRKIAPNTESDNVAILLQFLAAFGNVAGRNAYVRVEGSRHPPQIWPVLVGNTAKGRKGTSWSRVRELMGELDQAWADDKIIGGLSTGEGVMHAVRDGTQDEDGEGDPGVADKRLLVVESEFASVLRHMDRVGNILSATLRQLWDTGTAATLTKHTPTKTTGSMVTVNGHITDTELRQCLTKTDMANGLANRFLFALVRRSKELPFGGEGVHYQPFIPHLKEALARAYSDQRIMWAPDGADVWKAEYRQLSAGRGGLVGAVTSRAEAQVLRLALIYTLLDGKPAIEAAHVNAALAVWRYCEESAGIIFGSLTGNTVADAILRLLKAVPDGASRSDIHHSFARHESAAAITNALGELAAGGLVEAGSRATGGRPEERWWAKGAPRPAPAMPVATSRWAI